MKKPQNRDAGCSEAKVITKFLNGNHCFCDHGIITRSKWLHQQNQCTDKLYVLCKNRFFCLLLLNEFGDALPEIAEEETVARTEVVAALCDGGAGFGGQGEALIQTVLGTATETEVGHVAVEADGRQTVKFVLSEAAVSLHHVVERCIEDVADAVFREDVTVAAVEVAVLLDDAAMAANGLMDTETCRAAGHIAKRGLEHLHELVAYVLMAGPLVEDGAEELAVCLSGNTKRSETVRLFAIDAWWQSDISATRLRDAFHHGQELHEVAELAEEGIDFFGMVGIGGVDGGKRVEFHAVLLEQFEASHHATECSFPVRVFPIYIMEVFGAVNTQPDAEMMIAEEAAPVIGKQGAVGLKGVQNATPLAVLPLQRHRPLKKGNAAECRLTTMPGEFYLCISPVYLDDLTDVTFQHLIGHHPSMFSRVCDSADIILSQVVAVLATQVASCTDGFNFDSIVAQDVLISRHFHMICFLP